MLYLCLSAPPSPLASFHWWRVRLAGFQECDLRVSVSQFKSIENFLYRCFSLLQIFISRFKQESCVFLCSSRAGTKNRNFFCSNKTCRMLCLRRQVMANNYLSLPLLKKVSFWRCTLSTPTQHKTT